ncbi:AMP nucleosidase [Spirochaetota bacterium]
MKRILKPDTYAISTLERYTGSNVSEFGSHIILVNFNRYMDFFSETRNVEIKEGHWDAAHDKKNDISIINFGVGSPSAGIVAHCLSYLGHVESVLMLGMCGGIDDELDIGDIIIPTASVRDEGTSMHYLQPNVPAQPSFWINEICEKVVTRESSEKPRSGIMLTTDYRMWEFDEEYIKYILKHRIIAIDMEIATLFSVAYATSLPIGSIMLVSDMPLKEGGIKSKESAKDVFKKYTDDHFEIGTKVIEEIKTRSKAQKVKRLWSEW